MQTNTNQTTVGSIANWVSINPNGGIVTPSLIDAMEGIDLTKHEGLDISETWLNNKIVKRKPTTTKLTKIKVREWDANYNEIWTSHDIAFNRLTRMLNTDENYKYSKESVTLKNGAVLTVRVKKPYLVLVDNPILYMDFVESNQMDFLQENAYLKCVEEIEQGVKVGNVWYEYCMSSASQLRNLKGVFVRKDWVIPEAIIARFSSTIQESDKYIEFLRSLRGAEAILELMTFGAYSHEFSTKFAQYCGFSVEDKPTSLSKFSARAGMCLTSSIPFGTSWKVKCIGEVRFVWSDAVEQMFRNFKIKDKQGKELSLYNDKDIAMIKDAWKSTKIDGMSIMRASKVARQFMKSYRIHMSQEDVVGKLMQFRWAGVKGTALIMPDEVLDMVKGPDGAPIYKDYDLIVEASSWKYTPAKFYSGKMAPELELVALSKTKYSHNMNYQFCQSLDGRSFEDVQFTIATFKKLIDAQFNSMKTAMTNPEAARAKLGMTQAGSILDEIGVDEHEMTQKSKITKALAHHDDVIYDNWWRKKFIDVFTKSLKDDCKVGKIEAEGANRFIITDPIAMLRADLMDDEGNITITEPSQVGLGYMKHVYWANKSQEAVLFRSPCIHPGEPQRVTLVGLDTIPEYIPTAFGNIPCRAIYDTIKDIIVINGFSTILDALGGADTDGDTNLVVTDPDIVALRDEARKTVLVNVPSTTLKEVLDMDSIRANMVRSLRNNGIGLITNYATTWRDIQVCVQVLRKVPKKVAKYLAKVREEARTNLAKKKQCFADDFSLEAIANMNVDDWQSVYKTCNLALKELRKLQEMSINTAKSGIWVEFGSTDPEVNNYLHLALRIRASWHKPHAKQTYDSSSVMGTISKYVEERWKELHKWAAQTSGSLFLADKTVLGVNYDKVFNEVNRIRANYGTTVNNLQFRRVDEETFALEFDELTSNAHAQLTLLSMQYGVDMVAVACYDASHSKDSKGNGEGASFVWNCFFEEFLATLQYLSIDNKTSRLYKVFLSPLFTYEQFIDNLVSIKERKVVLDGIEIGTANVVDGDYQMVNIDGMPFVKIMTERPTIQAISASLAGERFALTGFGYWEDKVQGGMLTADRVMEYLMNSTGQGIIKTEYATFEKYGPDPRVACYIRISKEKDVPNEQKFMCIGVIPFDEKVLSRALANKAMKVKIDSARVTEKRIPITVEEVLFDYNQQ